MEAVPPAPATASVATPQGAAAVKLEPSFSSSSPHHLAADRAAGASSSAESTLGSQKKRKLSAMSAMSVVAETTDWGAAMLGPGGSWSGAKQQMERRMADLHISTTREARHNLTSAPAPAVAGAAAAAPAPDFSGRPAAEPAGRFGGGVLGSAQSPLVSIPQLSSTSSMGSLDMDDPLLDLDLTALGMRSTHGGSVQRAPPAGLADDHAGQSFGSGRTSGDKESLSAFLSGMDFDQ